MVELKTINFDEQVERLAGLGLPGEGPSREELEAARPAEEMPRRSVLVPSRELIPPAELAAKIEREGRPVVYGHLPPEEIEGYEPIELVGLPQAPAYLVVDVDLGAGSRNVPPEQALREILDAGRSPLTIDEGIALMLQQPEAIAVNWGFSMAGSRRGDQRVPAFWISEGNPKLGWCWDRNPHTWLGVAHAAGRAAVGR